MKLSRFDLLDRFSGYSFKHTTIHKKGYEITYDAIAFDDIEQALDEFMGKNDIIQIISEYILEINDYVWFNDRIFKITDIIKNKIEIMDLETRQIKKVNKNEIKLCLK